MAVTWILILSVLTYSNGSHSSITSAGPFYREEACMAAAKAWLSEFGNDRQYVSQRSALCVRQQ